MHPKNKPETGFASLIDQERPVRLLTAVLSSGNLPHAFLFTGLEGIGKKTAAMAVAMACNCLESKLFQDQAARRDFPPPAIDPCGQCRSCKKIISGHHPDIIFVEPAGDMIKVDQIRALSDRLTLKPYEASKRVAIIRDAHKFNTEAANTLLKTLEEPPDHTLFILTALQASDMLPTIVSRCQQIRFNPIHRKSLATYVTHHYGVTEAEAAVIASMARGSRTCADSMAQAHWINSRNWIISEMEALPSRSVNGCLAFAETLSKHKDWVSSVFEIMKNWLRDIAVYQCRPERIINRDLLDQLQTAARRTTSDSLVFKFKAIEQAERDIKSNANLRLTLDALIITLSKGS
ncbi:MAG: DNA polymerase III subunit delta' [Desulfosalsimonadaceae bacterium]|nr:DNA polymerase III subunit delta' [Desulfosalsimonadaceae bacterium]